MLHCFAMSFEYMRLLLNGRTLIAILLLYVYFYILNGADMFHCTQLLTTTDFSV